MRPANLMALAIATLSFSGTSFVAFDASAQQMSAVTQLGWLRNGEYAPLMVAEAKGCPSSEHLRQTKPIWMRGSGGSAD